MTFITQTQLLARSKATTTMARIRNIVHLSDTPLKAIDLVRLFPDAIYNASRNAYSIGNTLFVMPKFTLDSNDYAVDNNDTQGND
jgi:hypothetical protein